MRMLSSFVLCALIDFSASAAPSAATKVVINSDRVLEINGKKVFHIGFDLPPLPDAKAHNGRNGIEELRDAGATFLQTGPPGKQWWTNEASLALEQRWEDAAAKNGMYCWVRLNDVPAPGDAAEEEKFKQFINRFKNHPGMG